MLLFTVPHLYAQSYIPSAEDSNFIYRSIEELPDNPQKVFRLHLPKKKLDAVPQEVFKLVNLRELVLNKNRITELPADISTLRMLERLDLSNNKLRRLPDEIGALESLLYLGLNRNLIEELPQSMGRLESLEVLELWDNELSTVPDEIFTLDKLRILELRGILFSDEEIARIKSLVPKGTSLYISPPCNCGN